MMNEVMKFHIETQEERLNTYNSLMDQDLMGKRFGSRCIFRWAYMCLQYSQQ